MNTNETPGIGHKKAWLSRALLTALAICCYRLASTLAEPAGAPEPANTRFLPATETRLPNGLRVVTVPDPNSAIVAVQVWYRVGSADEPESRHGFAHLFEHMMFRGTDRLGPTDHMDLIKGVGGECNAYTAFDETCYHETVPKRHLELALWLESERMASLTVDAHGFDTERKVVEEERRMYLNQPYGDLGDIALPVVFAGHAYANSPIGNITDLRRATPGDVHDWWVKWYTPDNATLVVAGDVRPERVRALAERYFGWIPAGGVIERRIATLPQFPQAEQRVFKPENAPAPAVGIVWRTVPEGDPDTLPLELVASILGGGESSRLYRRLVAENRMAVAAMSVHFGLAHGGAFGAGAVLSPLGGEPGKVLPILQEEIARLRNEGPTEVELEKARNQAMSKLVLGAETAAGRAQLAGRAVVLGAGMAELQGRLGRIASLTVQDLKAVAQKHLAPEHAMTVTIPGSGLLGQIGKFFLGARKAEEEAPKAAVGTESFKGRPGTVRPASLPKSAPAASGTPAIPVPKVVERRLANGLRLLIAPDPDTPSVHMVLALPSGAWAESKPGAAFLAMAVAPKATTTRDERSLAEELERHAIELSASADQDDCHLVASSLAEEFDRAVRTMADVVLHPAFPTNTIATVLGQARTEIAMTDNNPASVAEREFKHALFPNHPYGRRLMGNPGELEALKREDLVAFWRETVRPDTGVLVISGAVKPDVAVKMVQDAFQGWTPPQTKPAQAPPSPFSVPLALQSASTGGASESGAKGKTGRRIVLVDWPGAGQSEIRVGGRGIPYADPRKPVADLVTSYFGGSMGSRLMKSIRVESGSTYGASGGFQPTRLAGCFEVRTFTKTASTVDTLRAVLTEIDRLRERPPGAEELRLQQNYLLGSAVARLETPGQVAEHVARLALNGLPMDQLRRNLRVVAKADARLCNETLAALVDPNDQLMVVVGDASRIQADLEKVAPVTAVLDRSGKPKGAVDAPSGR